MNPSVLRKSRAAATLVAAGLFTLAAALPAAAGPYAPAAGQSGSTAIADDDTRILAWANGYLNFAQGPEAEAYDDPALALGPAVTGDFEDDVFEVVSLGQGGQITLTFPQPIGNGSGPDFAVFENAITDGFLELAFVEVSADGVNFVRFPANSLTPSTIPTYGQVDPTNVDGLAGKYRYGFGTPFDLQDLVDLSLLPAAAAITHVRLIDIIGDGTALDSAGRTIYDPYPTASSAGFDLDAIAVLGTSPSAWREEHFTAAELANPDISGDLADPDGDTIVNLLERAFHTNPRQANPASQLPRIDTTGTHLKIIFPRSLSAMDVTIRVYAGDNLSAMTEIARGASGSPIAPVGSPGASSIQESGSNTRREVTVHDSLPLSSSRTRFMKISVTAP